MTTQRYLHLSPAAHDAAIQLLDGRGNVVATATAFAPLVVVVQCGAECGEGQYLKSRSAGRAEQEHGARSDLLQSVAFSGARLTPFHRFNKDRCDSRSAALAGAVTL